VTQKLFFISFSIQLTTNHQIFYWRERKKEKTASIYIDTNSLAEILACDKVFFKKKINGSVFFK
jgi:hypothetical protein